MVEEFQDPERETDPVPRRLSEVMLELAAQPWTTISLDDILDALSERSFSAMLILFAAFNMLPLPPGTSMIFGIPLILISLQLLIGLKSPWFPAAVRRKSFSQRTFRTIVGKLEPLLLKLEKLAHPRYWPFPRLIGDRIAGAAALFMACIVVLPIPFGNQMPALGIIILSIGWAQRDGVWVGISLLIAALSAGIVIGIVASVGFAALQYFN